MHRAGIYAIVHVLSGRRYIGQTNSFGRRWSQHREALLAGIHHNSRLQKAWLSDGELAFKFEVLEVAPAYLQPVQLQQWLQKRESDLIQTYKKRGLAFNIVDAELVETSAAMHAARTPSDSVSARIHAELQTVKFRIAAAEDTVRLKRKITTEASSRLVLAKSRQSQSIGFMRALFGQANRSIDIDNAKQVALAEAELAHAAADLATCSGDLEILLARRRDLYNAYPGNARRANIRRRAWGMF